MNKVTISVLLLALVSTSLIGSVYAYNAIYEDSTQSSKIPSISATLESSQYDGVLTLEDGNILFGSVKSEYILINYSDANSKNCYLTVMFTGFSGGEYANVRIVQGSNEFEGSATISSDGTAHINGIGSISNGTMQMYASITGTVADASNCHIEVKAFPEYEV